MIVLVKQILFYDFHTDDYLWNNNISNLETPYLVHNPLYNIVHRDFGGVLQTLNHGYQMLFSESLKPGKAVFHFTVSLHSTDSQPPIGVRRLQDRNRPTQAENRAAKEAERLWCRLIAVRTLMTRWKW